MPAENGGIGLRLRAMSYVDDFFSDDCVLLRRCLRCFSYCNWTQQNTAARRAIHGGSARITSSGMERRCPLDPPYGYHPHATLSQAGEGFYGVKSSSPLRFATNAASRSAARSMSSSEMISTALCM